MDSKYMRVMTYELKFSLIVNGSGGSLVNIEELEEYYKIRNRQVVTFPTISLSGHSNPFWMFPLAVILNL